jgi:hypothetical protein
MSISKISTNLKSQKLWSVDLKQKNLIIGDSASGKSAITQALELAVSARLSDMQGRQDSAQRTVQKTVTSADELQVIALTEGPSVSDHVLGYRVVREAVTSSGMSALIQLVGHQLHEDLRVKITEYQAFEKAARAASSEVKELERTRDRIEAWEGIPAELRVQMSERIVAASGEVDKAKASADALQTLLWPELTMQVQALVREAQLYVPTKLGHIIIDTGNPQSPKCIVGLVHDELSNTVRYGLSGAEWNICLTALACALDTDGSSLIIPDDRAISRELLQQWLKLLGNAQSQIVLTCVEPPDSVPSGWNAVRVTEPGKVSQWQPKVLRSLRVAVSSSKVKRPSKTQPKRGASRKRTSTR